jgi:elongation factor Ts
VTLADISAQQVRELRERTGAGMMDAKRALQDADGDMTRAEELLRERGLKDVQKRAGRSAAQGLVDSYIHFNNTVGVLVEVNCETDFVAATQEFKDLTRDIALHVASAAPRWLTRDEIPSVVLDAERRVYEAQAREQDKPDNVIERMVEGKLEAFYRDNVLLDQKFVKDDSKSIRTIVDEVSAKVGEKVAVRRFVRYKLGEELD